MAEPLTPDEEPRTDSGPQAAGRSARRLASAAGRGAPTGPPPLRGRDRPAVRLRLAALPAAPRRLTPLPLRSVSVPSFPPPPPPQTPLLPARPEGTRVPSQAPSAPPAAALRPPAPPRRLRGRRHGHEADPADVLRAHAARGGPGLQRRHPLRLLSHQRLQG